ncbi:MAG: hypothetical protein H3C26_12950 [Rhodocyclaceae bacterium]|nr:hypothetical protein [Rhodocyclaceae bacterium]
MKTASRIAVLTAALAAGAALADAGEATAPDEAEPRLIEQTSAEEAARRRREEAEAQQLAARKEAEEHRRERERRCVIRPVMSDAEIATCKEVWR